MTLRSSFVTLKPALKPSTAAPEVWVDANDYAVGSLANGTTITNKGSNGVNFVVEGTGMSIQVNSKGKKEFVFGGSVSITAATGNKPAFTKYHNYTSSYAIMFIGTIGTTSNPDAFYGICGNNGGASTNHGLYAAVENRVAQPTTKGFHFRTTKATSNVFPLSSIKYSDIVKFNTRTTFHTAVALGLLKDYVRIFVEGDLFHVSDSLRSGNNTTSGLGTNVAPSGVQPTYDFQIGAIGNNAGRLTGTMEQFMILPNSITWNTKNVRAMENYFDFKGLWGKTDYKYIDQLQTISDEYVLGGWYHKNTDKSKTLWVTSKGANHYTPGTDRTGVQSLSIHNGRAFPAYSDVFVDASTSPHGGMSGGLLPSGKGIIAYGKYNSSTGVYSDLVVRLTTDFETWGSEVSVGIPSTSPALTGYVFHDIGVLADNGDMMIPWYAVSGTSLYNIYAMRVSSDGTAFSHKLIYTSGSTYKNEVSIARISSAGASSKWIAAVRVEGAANTAGTYLHEFFKSTDDGETWTTLGTSSYGGRMYVYPHPPMIRTFLLNGTLVMAFYFVDRGDRRWWVMYVTASDFDTNGVSALNNTLYQLDIRLFGDDQGWESGYPVVIHPNNTMEAEGVYHQETSATVCSTTFLRIDREHEARVKTELGI